MELNRQYAAAAAVFAVTALLLVAGALDAFVATALAAVAYHVAGRFRAWRVEASLRELRRAAVDRRARRGARRPAAPAVVDDMPSLESVPVGGW
jgi:hypothetical protein